MGQITLYTISLEKAGHELTNSVTNYADATHLYRYRIGTRSCSRIHPFFYGFTRFFVTFILYFKIIGEKSFISNEILTVTIIIFIVFFPWNISSGRPDV